MLAAIAEKDAHAVAARESSARRPTLPASELTPTTSRPVSIGRWQ
jgi:hypothetical protein